MSDRASTLWRVRVSGATYMVAAEDISRAVSIAKTEFAVTVDRYADAVVSDVQNLGTVLLREAS